MSDKHQVSRLVLAEMKRVSAFVEEDGDSLENAMWLKNLAGILIKAAREISHMHHYGCHSKDWRGKL